MHPVLRALLVAFAVAGIPATAFAHTGVGDTSSFLHGFTHPIGGVDHVLAMVAVGMFAACLTGRALWLVPAAFVLTMAAGGLLGVNGVTAPLIEIGIAASVIVLGMAVALRWSLPTIAAMALVGFFAIFHGQAHGAEMPADVSGLAYGLGFMAGTAILHLVGISVGLGIGGIGARASRVALQAGGGIVALAGVGLLANYF